MIELTSKGYQISDSRDFLDKYRQYLDIIVDLIVGMKEWEEIRVL
jgi:hypothetical protein